MENNFTEEQIQHFYDRIDNLNISHQPLFGKMNVNQMICHCADFFRMAMGTKKAEEYGVVDPNEIMAIARSGKTAPTPKGFDQVAGDGTKPTEFENDKRILKALILKFSTLDKSDELAPHPYFGKKTHNKWAKLATYHLNHHLTQFGV